MNRRSLIAGLAALPIAAAIPTVAAPRHEIVEVSYSIGLKSENGGGFTIDTALHNADEATARLTAFAETASPGDSLTILMDCMGEKQVVGTYTA